MKISLGLKYKYKALHQPQYTHFCRKICFVAIYVLLGVLFSAIHGDEWLFHDYVNASAALPTLAQGCQR